jgi:hypothetical protein
MTPPPLPWSAERAAALSAEALRLAAAIDTAGDWLPAARAFDDCYLARDLAGCRAAVAELARIAAAVPKPDPCRLCGALVYLKDEAGETCPQVGAFDKAVRRIVGRCPYKGK